MSTTPPPQVTPSIGAVPLDLRLDRAQRWVAANVIARRLGTVLARHVPPWRWIAAAVWFTIMTLTRPDTAGVGRACAGTQTFTPRRPWARAAFYAAAAVIAGLGILTVVNPGVVLAGLLSSGPIGCVFVVFLVENARDLPAGWHRRNDADRAAAAVRATGHTEPIVIAAGLASEDAHDAVTLARRWLRHVDDHHIAVVARARTERLARAYRAQGFTPAEPGNSLLLLRLPRP